MFGLESFLWFMVFLGFSEILATCYVLKNKSPKRTRSAWINATASILIGIWALLLVVSL